MSNSAERSDRHARVRSLLRGIRNPRWRYLRLPLGFVLVMAGVLGFLPILGFWMVPLGLLVLSIDIPALRPLARRVHMALRRKKSN